jgi:hypothetical protein
MTILSSLRDSFFGAADVRSGSDTADAPAETTPPFDGYDRLNDKQVIGELPKHSQVELEAVEGYERSHRNRLTVLDKLRYMRGSEPLPGYDEMSVREINAALESADMETINRVRGYERKFAKRPDVLEEVDRVRHAHRATNPAPAAPPAYQPASAPSARAD